jgi:hypothetical protein
MVSMTARVLFILSLVAAFPGFVALMLGEMTDRTLEVVKVFLATSAVCGLLSMLLA